MTFRFDFFFKFGILAFLLFYYDMISFIFPDVPDSKKFDVSLMILLLRNLTALVPPISGYETLPLSSEITPAADLARIKYYRNFLAHLDDGKIDSTLFSIAWDNVTCVSRL